MKAVTRFESEDGEVYDNEDDAKFADLVWQFDENLKDDISEYGREQVVHEVRLRLGYRSHSTKLTYFLKWVRRERHAFTKFLEAIKHAD